MKFSINRLCGGKALMLSSTTDLNIDMETAIGVLSEMGEIKENDELMIVLTWNGMEVTFYPQGKIMFHPLSETETAVGYATDILGRMIPKNKKD